MVLKKSTFTGLITFVTKSIEASSLSSLIIKKPLIKSMQSNQPVQLVINYNAIKGNQDRSTNRCFINNKKF